MLTLLQGPQSLPVSIPEVKAAGRLDGLDESEDVVIAGLIRSAVAEIDGAHGWLGRALISQSWTLWLDHFPRTIRVPLPPLQSVDAIRYDDADGVSQTLAPRTTTRRASAVPGASCLLSVRGGRRHATYRRPSRSISPRASVTTGTPFPKTCGRPSP